jgi:bidirectional [NiFe] hydrogenase diaphorase subunit
MTIEELDQIAEQVRTESAKRDYEINVCMGTGCLSQHSDRLKDKLTAEVAAQGKNAFVRRTGCMGLCAAGPLALVDPDEILYQHLSSDNAKAVVASLGNEPIAELQCNLREHFDQQVHVVLENSGHIDPEKIDDYIAHDGYRALLTALNDMTPNGVIRQITAD